MTIFNGLNNKNEFRCLKANNIGSNYLYILRVNLPSSSAEKMVGMRSIPSKYLENKINT